jgi:hypothetical protein
MHRSPNTPRSFRVTDSRFAALAVLAALLVGCTMAASKLAGVSPERSLPTTCIASCTDLYSRLVSQEMKLREENVAACRLLPQPQRGACLEEEGARHAAEMMRLEQLRAACNSSCAKNPSAG